MESPESYGRRLSGKQLLLSISLLIGYFCLMFIAAIKIYSAYNLFVAIGFVFVVSLVVSPFILARLNKPTLTNR